MDRRGAILFAACALAGAILFYVAESSRRSARPKTQPAAAQPTPPPATPAAEPEPTDRIGGVLAKLRRSSVNASDLALLRRDLFADPAAGIAAIRRFLATHEDASTGQPFTVGTDGTLLAAPTLRLFLLDLLGRLSREMRSGDGAAVAREILEKKDSPDEWALALRNVAWAEPKSRPFLAQKMHEMLGYEPWIASPTGGMIEAFDVAVFSGDPTFIPTLAELSRGQNTSLQRAATVALDRLAETSPLAVMNYLNANPATIADLPYVRADYFAKANLADVQQRSAVEQYLDRADVGVPEKTKFIHAVASPGSFVADSLLSTASAPDDGTARQAGIAAAAAEWVRTNRFPPLREHVVWLHERVTLAE